MSGGRERIHGRVGVGTLELVLERRPGLPHRRRWRTGGGSGEGRRETEVSP
uniref:Uncharacterized protein n=1 Tax=Arundo donax TaxID=35708 RepID=A0A0A9D7M4_ARUDO